MKTYWLFPQFRCKQPPVISEAFLLSSSVMTATICYPGSTDIPVESSDLLHLECDMVWMHQMSPGFHNEIMSCADISAFNWFC